MTAASGTSQATTQRTVYAQHVAAQAAWSQYFIFCCTAHCMMPAGQPCALSGLHVPGLPDSVHHLRSEADAIAMLRDDSLAGASEAALIVDAFLVDMLYIRSLFVEELGG